MLRRMNREGGYQIDAGMLDCNGMTPYLDVPRGLVA